VSRGKLVRDGIPGIITARGDVPLTRIAEPADYRVLLRAKLAEEAREAAEASPAGLADELADVLEVVDAIAADAGISREELGQAREAKLAERGGFGGRVVWMGNEGEPAPARQLTGLSAMLREGHDRFGASAPAQPTAELDPGCEAVRADMLREEVGELEEAIEARDLPQIAKEGADVIYVVAGTLITFGIDVDSVLSPMRGHLPGTSSSAPGATSRRHSRACSPAVTRTRTTSWRQSVPGQVTRRSAAG
jgi:predicted house-cleaning noncanonical NTP pyrophosphatase (MazG superfamily)